MAGWRTAGSGADPPLAELAEVDLTVLVGIQRHERRADLRFLVAEGECLQQRRKFDEVDATVSILVAAVIASPERSVVHALGLSGPRRAQAEKARQPAAPKDNQYLEKPF